MSKAIGRTIKAMERKVSNMGLRRQGNERWTDKQVRTLITLRKKGRKWKVIGEALNRSELAVKLKARYIGLIG